MPLLLASLTDPLVNLATHLIDSIGLAGVALLTLTSGVIGIPGTEPTMLFAGFDVFQGNLTLPGIIIAGVIGDVAGASIAYAIGYFGGRELLRVPRLQAARERSAAWNAPIAGSSATARRSSSSRACCRFIRAAFPYAAGVARMPYLRFVTMATLGSIIWIGGLAVLGREVGPAVADLAPSPGVRRLRRRGDPGRRRRLPDRPVAAAPQRRRWHAASPSRRRMSSPTDSGRGTHPQPTSPPRPPRSPSDEALLLGALHGPGGAPADLVLRSHRAHPVAAGLGLLRRSTPSCARPSRWRCTPARPRRC